MKFSDKLHETINREKKNRSFNTDFSFKCPKSIISPFNTKPETGFNRGTNLENDKIPNKLNKETKTKAKLGFIIVMFLLLCFILLKISSNFQMHKNTCIINCEVTNTESTCYNKTQIDEYCAFKRIKEISHSALHYSPEEEIKNHQYYQENLEEIHQDLIHHLHQKNQKHK